MIDTVDLQKTISILDSIDQAFFKSDVDRYAAKEAVRRLLARLETPFERAWSLTSETPVLVAGLQVGSDLGIWEKWVRAEDHNQGAPVSSETILSWCDADVEPALLRKFMRRQDNAV